MITVSWRKKCNLRIGQLYSQSEPQCMGLVNGGKKVEIKAHWSKLEHMILHYNLPFGRLFKSHVNLLHNEQGHYNIIKEKIEVIIQLCHGSTMGWGHGE